MSLPRVLAIDDSEAILTYVTAALSSHYVVDTALNGREGLERARAARPAVVLLDLSMPVMNGEEVLEHLQADPELQQIPVIAVSSEHERAAACVGRGATSWLPKPVRAPELLAVVSQLLEEGRKRALEGSLAVLPMSVGNLHFGVALDAVRAVIQRVATRPVPAGPEFLRELIDYHGEPVLVLDAAERLGVTHEANLLNRMLVILRAEHVCLALCVDGVSDPEVFAPEAVVRRERLGGGEHGELREALVAIVRGAREPVPILEPRALVSRELLETLSSIIRRPGGPS